LKAEYLEYRMRRDKQGLTKLRDCEERRNFPDGKIMTTATWRRTPYQLISFVVQSKPNQDLREKSKRG